MASRYRVVAVAGRRIDAPDADVARFPESAEPRVTAAVARLLKGAEPDTLVASAACGADLIALEAAAALGIRTIIVLPFDRARFRETSVTDRGEAWGPRYDRALERAAAHGEVIVLDAVEDEDDESAYARATARIIDEALTLAKRDAGNALALAIWDENPRESTDATQDFVNRARSAGIETKSIATVG